MAELENKIVLEDASQEDYEKVNSLTKDKFDFVPHEGNIHDQAFETKPVSYLHDCFNRFCKSKSAIVGAVIIVLVVLYAIIAPFACPTGDTSKYPDGFRDSYFSYATPYNAMFKGTGFWDGTDTLTINEAKYYEYTHSDSNHDRLVKINGTRKIGSVINYDAVIDTYAIGNKIITLSKEDLDILIQHEKDAGVYQTATSIMKPIVDYESYLTEYRSYLEENQSSIGITPAIIDGIISQMRTDYQNNADISYALKADKDRNKDKLVPNIPTGEDEAKRIYKTNEDGSLVYYQEIDGGQYQVRVDYFDYFTYLNGFEPYFIFGTNASGQDIFVRLALGARFSLILGVGISIINFIIGLIWGAISGYYGGTTDLIMERITDIISNIPSLVVLTICSIQFTSNPQFTNTLGSSGTLILALLIAFVYSGWVGVASTTRMQFYRFKGQEYVLASRTLGAKDRRLIFKHILPNAIGTLITSSVLMIPSIIFSESSLSYLGIINFSTSSISSIGTLLNEGQAAGLQNYPYVILFPSLVITLLMISFNLFGNGLRDAFNTSLKGSED